MKPFVQASAASVVLCGLMVLFAFASDTVTVADEPAVLTAAVIAGGEVSRGETPIGEDGPGEDGPLTGSSSLLEESSLLGGISESADVFSAEPSSAVAESSEEVPLVSSSAPSLSAPPISFVESEMSEAAPPSQETPVISSEAPPPSSAPISSVPSEPSVVSSLPASPEPPPSLPASSASSVAPSSEPSSVPPSRPASGETVTMRVNGASQEMDLYTALCQVVEAEMGGSYHAEALKAQAVAAYSYIRYENARGAAASLPMRAPTQKTCGAVSAVLGEALYYGGSIAFTPYHASSAGWTNPSEEVWANGYSYLTRVESPHDPSSANRNVKAAFSAARIQSGLEKFLGIALDSGNPGGWLQVASVSPGGYVLSLEVTAADGSVHTMTGRQMRENVLSYGIRSHAFTVSWDGQQFNFITNGYGHGVGMSQTGAEGYAQDGWGYRQILAHYYPGTAIG